MIKIYVLKLENNKYYIGQSVDTENRLDYHIKGKLGAEWTKLHKPLELIESISTQFTETSEAMFLENSVTINYMKKFGWMNVRGGDYCTLDEDKLRFLLCNNSDLGNEILPVTNKFDYNLNMHGVFIYTLKLECGNYFVGKTKNLKIGILKSYNGLESDWCKKFKPVDLVSVLNVGKYDEKQQRNLLNEQVIKLMSNTDWTKVRGGDYFRIEQADHRKKVLRNTNLLNNG